jgi:DNA-binding IscR family transcriptional regulator
MWGKLNNIINQYLDHITLDDLIHNTIEERLKNKDWLK